jgi:hypothetical protein
VNGRVDQFSSRIGFVQSHCMSISLKTASLFAFSVNRLVSLRHNSISTIHLLAPDSHIIGNP